MYKKLKGICVNCLGCNRLENEYFEGVDKCEYATEKQLEFQQIKIEGE